MGKIAFPRISERLWTGVYVLFGWVAVIALDPLRRSLPVESLLLLLAGGLVYTAGSLLFLNRRLPFGGRRPLCRAAALHHPPGGARGRLYLLGEPVSLSVLASDSPWGACARGNGGF